MKFYIIKIFVLAIGLVFLTNCTTNDLDPSITQRKPVEGGITRIDNLSSLMRGVHSNLTLSGYYGRDMIINQEVRSDNCFSNGNSGRFTTQGTFLYNNTTGYMWDDAYEVIANLNVIINTDVSTLDGDQSLGKHIQGQAYALRALAHYDLLRVYGQQHSGGSLGVPIQTQYTGDGDADLFLPRSTVSEVQAAIYADLDMGYSLMDDAYDSKNSISKLAAKAIESRIAIYFGEWTRAKDAASEVVTSGKYSILPATDFVDSWSTDATSNSIFELEFNGNDNADINGLANIYRFPTDAPSSYGDIEVVASVASLFEATDVRGTAGILGYQDGGKRLRNMGKYPDVVTYADNVPLVRYEEVILNLAEALFEINNADPKALDHLNSIPSKRGATPYTSATKGNILLERRKELMFEGFRFDDLIRTNSSIDIIKDDGTVSSTLTYPNNLFAWPIPVEEINTNSNIIQNEGY